METIVFALIITFLLIHEMDAIRVKEYKMFIVLKNINDELAYHFFSILHIVIYFVIILVVSSGNTMSQYILEIVIDFFIIFHTIIHYCFNKHKANGFVSIFSKIIIYVLPILAVIHLYLFFK